MCSQKNLTLLKAQQTYLRGGMHFTEAAGEATHGGDLDAAMFLSSPIARGPAATARSHM